MPEILAALTSLAAAVAAVLAWAAKLQWSKEYTAAKEEVLRVKDEQIKLLEREVESLKELNPTKIREYFLSMREHLEEWVETLQKDLQKAHREIGDKDGEIARLQIEGSTHQTEIQKLRGEKRRIEDASSKLEAQLSQFREKYENDEVTILRIPRLDTQFYKAIERSAQELRNSMTHATLTSFDEELFEALRAYGSIDDLLHGLEAKLNRQEAGEEEDESESLDS